MAGSFPGHFLFQNEVLVLALCLKPWFWGADTQTCGPWSRFMMDFLGGEAVKDSC